MDKTYNPNSIESKIYKTWEKKGYFRPTDKGEPYCIMIPPPNVTGTLHMGHAFQDTIMDTLTRYHRMQGKKTLWQVGTDHAGIATQMVVERQLEKDGFSRLEMGRDNFTDKIWQWKNDSGNTISNQLRRIGASVDWTRERFTMDSSLSEAVTEVFVQLFEEKLIYRGKRLVNWDPVLLTALSDLEVNPTEELGKLWHLKYQIANSDKKLLVVTTRPETMLGDTAVAVNPNDQRYKHLIGQEIELPLCSRNIPIIADDYVDQEFGSGCVKITPGHDFNDFEIGQRHNLDVINIFTKDAKLNSNTPTEFVGLDRFKAREIVIQKMESLGLVDKIEDHNLIIPRGDRSGAILEPYLTDQWFVKIESLAQPAIDAVKNGDIKFVPENWSKTYFDWMNNIQDWCISRQLWWGHRIPAWYDQDKNVYVAKSEEEVRKKYQLGPDKKLKQDDDVLDTWFSSALWPFSTLGWPDKTNDLKTFYPTNVLVTGFDIIFFWVARMIMMGLKFIGYVPFQEVYIHGLVRDKDGQKMSKSKGNILDPIDLIDGIDLNSLIKKRTEGLMQPQLEPFITNDTKKEYPSGIPKFGTDALRFTFASMATTGRDVRFDLKRIEGYKNFCNKLWNAARFIIMNTERIELHDKKPNPEDMSLADIWIQGKLHSLITSIKKNINNYRIDLIANSLYDFVWNDYCNWYLELSKSILKNDDQSKLKQKRATQLNLLFTLDATLKCLHPIIPFITEELWQTINTDPTKKSIMVENYPNSKDFIVDQPILDQMDWLIAFVLSVRQIRSEMNISPKIKIPVLLQDANNKDLELMEKSKIYIKNLAGIAEIKPIDDKPPMAAIALLKGMKILIPLEGIIDIEFERKRCEKKLNQINKELDSMKNRLMNKEFITKAPKDVVENLRSQSENMMQDKIKMEEQVKILSSS
jgi:valyl-tRNA synthetase